VHHVVNKITNAKYVEHILLLLIISSYQSEDVPPSAFQASLNLVKIGAVIS